MDSTLPVGMCCNLFKFRKLNFQLAKVELIYIVRDQYSCQLVMPIDSTGRDTKALTKASARRALVNSGVL